MVMAAAAMTPHDFTVFSLLILVTFTSMGAVRAALFQPALIETRGNKDAHVSAMSATVGAASAGLFPVITAVVLETREPLWLLSIGITSMLPVYVEWLRMRAMALDRRWDVAGGDVARLAATVVCGAVLWVSTDVVLFFVVVNISYLTTFVYLRHRLPAVSAHVSPRRLIGPASSQLADFLFGQAVSTVPLLVLGSMGPSSYIGGVRLAQTLLGPLNLVFAASAYNLLSDSATRQSHAGDADLIAKGRRLALALSALSLILVPTLLCLLYLTGFGLRGVDNRSLVVGVALVGVLAITSGWAGIDTFVMRLLGHHAAPTVGRAVLVVASFGGYAAGYVLGGVDGSLVAGFIVAAVANPLVFVLPAVSIYRRHLAKDQAGGMVSS